MRCVCGETFGSHKPDESLPRRRHIYAAQQPTESRDEQVCSAVPVGRSQRRRPRNIVELANAAQPYFDNRILAELNRPFL
jgi:hypothetical protein